MRRVFRCAIVAAGVLFSVNGYGAQAAGDASVRSKVDPAEILATGKADLETVLLSRKVAYQEIIGIGKCGGFFAEMHEAEKKSHPAGKLSKSLAPGYGFAGIYLVGQYAKIESSEKMDAAILLTVFEALHKARLDAKASAHVLFEDAESNKEKISIQTNLCVRGFPMVMYILSQRKKPDQNK
ncbi:MAG: hypothetical protein JKY34_12805 [Kordiimonadaceae bacterium]|nr:hypothetical protein [Kordiimonadaceae bacterium]